MRRLQWYKRGAAYLQWDFSTQNPRSLIFIIFLYIKYLNPIFQAKMRLWYFFREKEWLKKQKIADLSFCFEFQVVVAVVGFKWRSWGNAKMADLRSRNAFKSLPQRNSLISIFNGFGFYFSILHRLWICHATLMI